MDPLLQKNLITTKSASELSGYTSDYLSRLIRSGKISGQKVGHSWLINSESLDAFINAQKNHNIDRARELATTRAKEYQYQQKLAVRIRRDLTKAVVVPEGITGPVPFASHALALSIACAVVVGGAALAQAAATQQLAERGVVLAMSTVHGFAETYGEVPLAMTANYERVKQEIAARPMAVAERMLHATQNITVPDISQPDLSFIVMKTECVSDSCARPSYMMARAESAVGRKVAVSIAIGPLLSEVAALTASPAYARGQIVRGFTYLGTGAYAGIGTALSLYRDAIESAGRSAFELAVMTRDSLRTAPRSVALVAHSFVDLTHAIIRADVSGAYGMAALAPASARIAVTAFGNVGSALASATAQVPGATAQAYLGLAAGTAHLAPALANAVFGAEYRGALAFVGATNTVTENYLALLMQSGSLAYGGAELARTATSAGAPWFAQATSRMSDGYAYLSDSVAATLSSLAGTHPLAGALAAAQPPLSLGGEVALATYQTIHSWYESMTNRIALMFSPFPTVVLVSSKAPVKGVAVATSSAPLSVPKVAPASSRAPNIYPTYTTVVQGVSSSVLDTSLLALKNDVLGTVAGMIRPVAAQGVTNMQTIQYVNMIQDLSNLIVRNGDFRGGTLTGGVSVSATTGNFTNLIAGGVDITGSLAAGTVSSNAYVSAPYFTATSATSTSTFAGSLGIGTTSPYRTLSISGSGVFTGDVLASTFTATSSISTPSFTLSGASINSLLSTNANGLVVATSTPTFGNFNATSTIATSTISTGGLAIGTNQLVVQQTSGNVGIGTTTPDALLALQQTTNGTPFISAYRVTDSAPAGDFINFKTKAGTTLYRVDNSGNLLAGGIINTGSQTITSTSSPQFRVQYDPSNEITTSVSSTGATTFGINGSAPSLTFTSGSNRVNAFNFTDALATNSILSIDTLNQRVGIGTTTGSGIVSIGGKGTVTNPALTIGNASGLFEEVTDGRLGFVSAGAEVANVIPGGVFDIGGANAQIRFGTTVSSPDTVLARDAANVLAQRNSTSAQVFRVYNTYTDASNYERGTIDWNNTANVLSIGTQAAGTGTLRNIALIGGNVGIGTTTPAAKLDVYGVSGVTENIVNTYGSAVIRGSNMSIASTTKGILDVEMSGSIGAQDLGPTLSFSNNFWQFGKSYTRVGAAIKSGKENSNNQSANSYLSLYSNTGTDLTEKMRITSTGNVGIGTTSPYRTLSISGSGVFTGDVLASTFTATSSISTPSFTLSGASINSLLSTNANGLVVATSTPTFGNFNATSTIATSTISTGGLAIGTNQLVVQQTSGNVGIGTTTPSSKLFVASGNIGLDIGANNGIFQTAITGHIAANAGSIGIGINDGGGSNSGVFVNNRFASSFSSQDITFLTAHGNVSAATERMRIDKDGNIGIGTTSPDTMLHVYNSQNGFTDIKVENPNTGNTAQARFLAKNDVGTAEFGLTGSGYVVGGNTLPANSLFFWNDIAAPIVFGQAGTASMYLSTTGKLGIGTTSPWANLSINPNGQSRPAFVIGSSTMTNFIVTDGGNVGIGTTTPGSILSIGNTGANTINISSTATSTFGTGINLGTGCFAVNGVCVGSGTGSGTIGSGTAGQFPYYAAGGTTLTATSSLFLATSGNIGIGTTSPYAKLSISNSATTPVNGTLFAIASTTGGTSTTTLMTVLANGNVGVGTTTPTAPLVVQGSGTGNVMMGSLPFANVYGYISLNGSSSVSNYNLLSSGTDQNLYLNRPTGNIIAFRMANADQMVINATGNVGIGTTTSNSLLTLASSTASGTVSLFSISSSSPIMTVLANGNVGIGTTTPSEKLDVLGNLRLNSGNSAIQSYLTFANGSTNEWYLASRNATDAPNNRLSFFNANGSNEIMTLLQGGNVGIGTTSPGAKLTIEDSSSDASFTGTAYSKLAIRAADTIGNWRSIDFGASGGTSYDKPVARIGMQYTGSGSYLAFGTSNAYVNGVTNQAMTISPTGNVGIGTTTPTNTLHVQSAANTPLLLDSTSGSGSFIKFAASSAAKGFLGYTTLGSGGMSVLDSSGNNVRLLIDSSGNVGIGTVSPANTLDIGNGGGIHITSGTPVSTAMALYNNAGTLTWNGIALGTGSSVSGTTNYIPVFTGASSLGNSVLYQSGGNVGIGTTSPGDANTKLEVYNTGHSYIRATSGGTSFNSAFASYDGTNTVYSGMFPASGGAAGLWSVYNGGVRLSVASNGNVGIGTTSPTSRLQVTDSTSNLRFGNNLSSGSGGPSLMLESSANVYDDIVFNTTGADQVRLRGSSYGLAIGGTNSRLNIGYADANYTSSALVVNGNVGIGTASPANTLDIGNGGGIHITSGVPGSTAMALYNNAGTLTWNGVALGTGSSVSGTTNYIPVFTAANALGNSVLYQTGGKVGIGTTTPGAALDVWTYAGAGDAYFGGWDNNSGYNMLSLNGMKGNDYNMVSGLSDKNLYINRPAGASIFFRENNAGTNQIAIASGGNLGVGSTSPWARLAVTGTSTDATNAFLVANSNNLPLFNVLNNGNIGIGTTSPQNKLVVSGNALFGGVSTTTFPYSPGFSTQTNPYIEIGSGILTSTSDHFGSLILSTNQSGTNAVTGGITFVNSNLTGNERRTAGIASLTDGATNSGSLNFYTVNAGVASASNMVIDHLGNVGIGTTTPGGRLTVDGDGTLPVLRLNNTSTGDGLAIYTANATANNGLLWYQGVANLLNLYSGSDNSALLALTNNGASSILFNTNGNSYLNGGNVGIGTTTPGSILDIQSASPKVNVRATTGTNIAFQEFSNTGSAFYLGVEGSNGAQLLGTGSAYDATLGTGVAAGLRLVTNNATRLYLNSTGNVGIGTTSPASSLSIDERTSSNGTLFSQVTVHTNENLSSGTAGGGNLIKFTNFTGTTGAIGGYMAAVSNFGIGIWGGTSAGSPHMFVNNSGNLGVGTSTPATLLEVGGATANVTFDGYKNCTGFTSNANGLLACTASDARLKQNIAGLDAASTLAALGALAPVSFYWNPATERGPQQQYGLIAQQVQQVFPNLVTTSSPTSLTPDGTLSVNYEGLISPMILAIQTLDTRSKFIQNAATSTVLTVDVAGNVGIGTTTPNHTLTVAGDVGAIAFVNTSTRDAKTDISYVSASSTEDMLNQLKNMKVATYRYKIEDQNDPLRLGFIAEDAQKIAPEILAPDGKGVDIYKFATFTLAGVQALAAKVDGMNTRITTLESRMQALESGAISSASGSPITLSTTSLASALNSFGVLIQKGIAQFNTLVFRQLVASKDADGTSSAGSVTILKGNVITQVNNSLVLPTTKVFVTFNSQITGTWWVSDKTTGSFRVVLSAAQAADVSFDYFLVQTEGQIATSTPDGVIQAQASGTTQSSGPDTVAPVITLLGDNPVHVSVGGTFTEPGITVTDNVDGTDPYVTFVNGIEQPASSATIDTASATTYIITYRATDRAGNNSTAMRSVIVGNPDGTVSTGSTTASTTASADTTAPVVTLTGAAALQLTPGDTFTDPGATALDNVDGNLTAKIVVTGAVDTATVGAYTLTYSATDAAGNSGSVSRLVSVVAAPATSSSATTTAATTP